MQINSAKNKQKLLDGWGAEYGHEIIELMMLENNLIPSLRFFSNKARLIKILKLIKLFRFEFNYSYDKYHQGYFIFISKSKPQAFLLKNNANSNKTAGKLLGFPACCIKAHFQSKALNSGTPIVPTIWEILANTKNTHYILDLNWGYNFFYHPTLYHLIPHFPCSFNCKKTEIMFNKFALFLKENYSKVYSLIKKKLIGKFTIFVPKNYDQHFFTQNSDDLVIFKVPAECLGRIDFYKKYKVNKEDYIWVPHLFNFNDD